MDRQAMSHQDKQGQTQIEHASRKIYAECERLYGSTSVQKADVDSADAGGTLGLYVLGPHVSRLVGKDVTRTVGQDVLLFGAAPLQGVCDTVRDQFQNHLVPTLTEGARNLGFGAAVSVAAELHPAVGAATLIGGTAVVAHEELLSDHARKRNAEIGKIGELAGKYSNEELVTHAKRVNALIGEDLYHLGYATLLGGIGARSGKALANEVAQIELSFPPLRPPRIGDPHLRPAYAVANAHDGSLPQLEIVEPLKMSAHKIPELNAAGVLPLGVHEATLEQIEARFAQNSHRKEIFDKMVVVLKMLKEAGCKRVWINGSFTTSKPFPGDFDIAFDQAGVDFKKLPSCFERPEIDGLAIKQNYGGDVKLKTNHPIRNPVAFFQQDGRTLPLPTKKGIVLLDLEGME